MESFAVEPRSEFLAQSPDALEQIERAHTDIQIATAKRYPRPDISSIKKKVISLATQDVETAQSCFYVLRRRGKDGEKEIRGPSVRLAEFAFMCYGNVRAGARVISNNGKIITSQGACHDLENNNYVTMEVSRRACDRHGNPYSEDMQIVTGNASNAIALRNAIFKIIPSSIVHAAYEQALKVAVGDAKTLASRRQAAFETFAKMGVSKERVLKVIERKAIEDVTLEDLEVLIGIHTAIKEGDQTIDEAFPAEKPVPPAPSIVRPPNSPVAAEAPPIESHPDNGMTAPLPPAQTGSPASAAAGVNSEPDPLATLLQLCATYGATEGQVIAFCRANQMMKKEQRSIRELSRSKHANLVKNWETILPQIKSLTAE